jgi:hypothetical protein
MVRLSRSPCGEIGVVVLSLALASLITSLAACGGEEDGGGATTIRGEPDAMSAGQVEVLRRAQRGVRSYCRARVETLAAGDAAPAARFERAVAGLRELGDLAAAEPQAEAPDGSTARLALGDIAEDLEGTNCDQRLVALIDARLAVLPQD